MNCIDKARSILQKTNSTCAFCNENTVLTDTRRGVRPLLDLIEAKMDVTSFSAADKVVGKAAAYLYCILNVKALHAIVISEPALTVLKERMIPVTYESLVPSIQNRTQTGPCPMEHAVWNIDHPEDALAAIYKTMEQLSRLG